MDNTENLPEDSLPRFLTVEQVAGVLNVSRAAVYRYISRDANPLPVVYLTDKTIRIPYDQFQIWLNDQSSELRGGEQKVDTR